MFPPIALPCPTKLIPMSDNNQEGIVGNVGETVLVTCDSGTVQVISCSAIGPDKAAWSGVLPCYGVCAVLVYGSLTRLDTHNKSRHRLWMSL